MGARLDQRLARKSNALIGHRIAEVFADPQREKQKGAKSFLSNEITVK